MSLYNKVANTNTTNIVPVQGTFDQYGNCYTLNGPGGKPFGGLSTKPNGNTGADIQNAIDFVYSNGGGTVTLDPIDYFITTPVIMKSKVSLIGVNPSLTYYGIPDIYNNTRNGGTWLVGNGTCNLLTVNDTDLTSQFSTTAAFSNAGITDVTIKNIGLYNGVYGLKVGGNFYPGAFYSIFENIMAYGCSQWGIWIENCLHNNYNKFSSWNNTVGQIQFRSSSVSQGGNPILAPGNCFGGEILASVQPNLLARGIEITATNGTYGGPGYITVLQCNRFNNPTFTPQTATGAGTTNLTVSDGTKFTKDLPVVFTAVGATGLSTNHVYFVTSVTGNVLTIAEAISSGTNVTISSGTATITTQGFAPIAGYGYTSNDRIGFASPGIDAEAGGTAKLIICDAIPNIQFGLPGVYNDAYSTVDVCIRNSSNLTLTNSSGVRIDLAGDSTTNSRVFGNCSFTGIYAIPVFGAQELNLATFRATDQLSSFVNKSPGGGDWTYPGLPIGQHQGSYGGSLNFGVGYSQAGFATYTGTGAATFTFTQTLGSGMKGFRQTFKNKGTGALTVTLGSTGDTFDGMTGGTSAGKSMLLAAPTTTTAGGSLTIVCCDNGSGGYFWAIESLNLATLV